MSWPPGLEAAFWAYERALMDDDLAAMDRLFAPGPDTLRGDADGLVVGHDAIAAFRRSRGGAPPRTVLATHVQPVDDDHALVVALTAPAKGGRGQQTQLWRRGPDGWQVTAAHVAVPAPALDPRVWRIAGTPLIEPLAAGPLDGWSVAVKDLYAVAGHPIGAGNPAWLAAAAPEPDHAPVVRRLLEAGAEVTGISRTDEFAWSLAGTNAHHGTPPNPAAPGRISGGSSSGSASAVALGQVRLGLGTDTGGSIRVPAAYQGLFGLRTTHGAVSRDGLLALAPSFDTVGWLTRTAADLAAVGDVLLPPADARPLTEVVVVPALLDLATPEVAAAVRAVAEALGAVEEDWDLTDLPRWRDAFGTWQSAEAWASHGDWVATRLETLGADVRGRFEAASRLSQVGVDHARAVGQAAGERIRALVGDRALVLPAASCVAPRPSDDVAAAREATLRLTCLAGLAGLPALTVPTTTADGLPAGACLLAAPGRDRDLLALGGLYQGETAVSPRRHATALGSAPMTIEELNALPAEEARAVLRACADVDTWVEELLAARPYATEQDLLDLATDQAAGWSEAEVDRALADHPRIGERTAAGSLSSGEQAGMADADDDLQRRMREGNAAYEERFGRIYLVRAAGRSAIELLEILEERLEHDADTEALETKRQLAEIAVLRLAATVSA